MVENVASAQELKAEGLRLFQEGLYEEAVAKFRQAQEMFAGDGNEVEAAEMVNNLGVIYRLQGQWDEAIAALHQARVTFVRLGDRNREAQTLGNLGGLYAAKGQRDEAKECLRQAAGIFAELGDVQRQLTKLACIHCRDRRPVRGHCAVCSACVPGCWADGKKPLAVSG